MIITEPLSYLKFILSFWPDHILVSIPNLLLQLLNQYGLAKIQPFIVLEAKHGIKF